MESRDLLLIEMAKTIAQIHRSTTPELDKAIADLEADIKAEEDAKKAVEDKKAENTGKGKA